MDANLMKSEELMDQAREASRQYLELLTRYEGDEIPDAVREEADRLREEAHRCMKASESALKQYRRTRGTE